MKRAGVAILTAAVCAVVSISGIRCSGINDAVKGPQEPSPAAQRQSDLLQDSWDQKDDLLNLCGAPSHSGFATYYIGANGGGNCMFDPTPSDLMVGAMNPVDYAGSTICGATVIVRGPRGTITIRVVDQCPGCQQGDIDLSPEAFSRIADLSLGRVPIKWKLVPASVQGNIVYHFKDGSNQWWTAVQIRNHRYPIAQFEYLTAQGFRAVRRMDYNYFVEATGMGPGPYTFRVTDIYGHVLVDSGLPNVADTSIPGSGQFPLCVAPLDY